MAKSLCDWKKTEILRDAAKLESLVEDPRYLCMKCARVANCKRVLCSPKPAFRAPLLKTG